MSNTVYSFRPKIDSSKKYEIVVEERFSKNTPVYYPYISEIYYDPSHPLNENSFIVWSGWCMEDKYKAKDLAVQNFHLITGDLKLSINKTTRNIDTELLVVHPKNHIVYPSDKYDDLVELLDRPASERVVVTLLVTPLGLVVSGNRRTVAARIVNQKHIKEYGKRLITDFPCDVKQFLSIASEVKHLLVRNQYRQLSEEQIARNLKVLLSLEKGKVLSNSSTELEKTGTVSNTQAAANAGKKLGFKASMVQAKVALEDKLVQLAGESPEKAEKLFELRELLPTHTLLSAVNDCSGEVQDLVVDELYERVILQSGKKPSIRKLIAKHTHNLERNRVREALKHGKELASKEEQRKRRIEIATNLGENADDCLLTPKELVSRFLEFLGTEKVDLDPFAEMEETGNIPAIKRYTIVENGLSKKWYGNVISTPPFSKTSEVLAKFEKEINRGELESAILLFPSDKLQNTTAAKFISNCDLLTLQISSRVQYAPSEYLEIKKPGSASKKFNKMITAVYFGSQGNRFRNHFKTIGLVQFNSIGRVGTLVWEDCGDSLTAKWFGRQIRISLNANGLYVPSVSGVAYDEYVSTDIKEAKVFAMAVIIYLESNEDVITENLDFPIQQSQLPSKVMAY